MTRKSAEFLKKNKESLLRAWEIKAETEIFASTKNPQYVVRNDLPEFIDSLIDILQRYNGNESERLLVKKSFDQKTSEKHGRERAQTSHYDLEQVIWEYSLLRQVIYDLLKQNELLDISTAEIVSISIEWSCALAGQEFATSLQSVQEKLIGTFAHDLKNPLSVALSAIQAGRDKLTSQEEIYELIERNISNSIFLLNELLDSTQVKAGHGMTFKFESSDLLSEIQDICEDAAKVYSNQINLESNVKQINGCFDSISVRRALENLISNAVKYGGSKANIDIKVISRDEHITISVHNTDSFIEKTDQEGIFNFLGRDSSLNSKRQKGWGLGLYLVKLVALAHEGKVWVESSKDKGTTFYLDIKKNAKKENSSFSQTME
tara:strand:- start:4765 stop:5895 length:1131 start_codon:yes stop_codon:yes gene_type:complete